ncbi:MAG: secondary thiamine-phosphate synthase enzyme YjbQ [Chloroflexota bacterium]
MLKTITFKTDPGSSLINLTDQIRAFVRQSGVQEGVCHVIAPHTTGAVTVNSYLDPKTAADLAFEVSRLVPTRIDFIHQVDGPTDAAGHIKTTLVGPSQTVIIHNGDLLLGRSQGIMFFEFDGPRERMVHVKVMAG